MTLILQSPNSNRGPTGGPDVDGLRVFVAEAAGTGPLWLANTRDAERLARNALELGLRLATHGRALRLSQLIEAAALLEWRRGGTKGLARDLGRLLPGTPGVTGDSGPVAEAWILGLQNLGACQPEEALQLLKCCRECLRDPAKIEEIAENLRNPKAPTRAGETPPLFLGDCPPESALASVAVVGRKSELDHGVLDWIDHGAADFFLHSGRIPPPFDRRIALLRKRRRPARSWQQSYPESYEMQHPFMGALLSLSCLAHDDLDAVAHAIRCAPRIASPPAARPKEPSTVVVQWLCGKRSFEAESAWRSDGENPVSINCAGLLQGLALRLVEEWREWLAGAPVDFRLHRAAPKPSSVEVPVPAGSAWSRFCGQSRDLNDYVPPEVASLVFERLRRLDFSGEVPKWWEPRKDGRWSGQERRRHWALALAAVEDLAEAGAEAETRPTGEMAWTLPQTWHRGEVATVPLDMAMVLELSCGNGGRGELPGERGWLCRVERDPRGRMRWRAVSKCTRLAAVSGGAPPFAKLRLQLFAHLLEWLHRRSQR